MANNYTQFSETIDNLTPEELEWWNKELATNSEQYEEDYHDWSDDRDRGTVDDAVIENNSIWFRAEESGDIDAVVNSVQRFLKAHRPDDYFILTWADSCSRPRVGEFGGGAVFVTADDRLWNPVYQWVSKIQNQTSEHLSTSVTCRSQLLPTSVTTGA